MILTDDLPAIKEKLTSKIKNFRYFKNLTIACIIVLFVLVSVSLIGKRTVFFKKAQTVPSQTYSPAYLCKYIPSSLYGAPESEWAKYECINNVARLRSAATIAVESQAQPLVENLQVPSVKSFASSVQTGEAAVSYPIELPPAAGGFVPSLSLNYSSGAVADMRYGVTNTEWVNGGGWSQGSMVGLGWNLSGVPQITKNGSGRYYLVIDGRSFELLGSNGSEQMPDGQDTVYTTKPNNYLKIVRKYEDPAVSDPHLKQPTDCGGNGSLGENNVDFRSWDIWTKDGKHYIFKRLGFIIKDINCSDGREHNSDFDNPGHCPFDNPAQTQKRKRFFNKWVLTEVVDPSGNKIAYEYSPKVGPNSESGNWQLTGNTLDECRDRCLSNVPDSRFSTDRNWDPCTAVCFGGKAITDNLVETGRKSKSQCNNEHCPNCSFDCKAFNLTCSRRSDCQAAGDTQWKDVCLKGCFDPAGDQSNHCNGGIFFPRAIYPVAIKYGVGIKGTTEDPSKTSRIEFVYDKRNDNNFGTLGEGTQKSSGDKKLSQIKVYLGANLIRTYQLTYSYDGSSAANGPSDSYSGNTNKTGLLMLDNIKLLGTDGSAFPVNQSFTYFPYSNSDMSKSFLLKEAGNGYGAKTAYDYSLDTVEVFNEGTEKPGEIVCLHFTPIDHDPWYECDSVRSNEKKQKPRLISKTTTSSFDTAKRQIVDYDYSGGISARGNCGMNDGTANCGYNGHASISMKGDYEFFGYSRVKETLSYQDSAHAGKTAQSAVYYNFNPGGYEINNGFQTKKGSGSTDNNPDIANSRKGTVARKTMVKFNDSAEIPISAENNTYETVLVDGDYKNLFYPQETKACSDLDIADANLRRGSYSKTTEDTGDFSLTGVFDNYGNPKKSRQFQISLCSVDFASSKYYPTVNISGQTVYRTTQTSYWYSSDKYIVDKPLISGARQGINGNYLKRTWMNYYDTGKLRATREADMDKWYQQGKTGTVNVLQTAFIYDNYGNLNTKRTYEGYAAATPTDQDNDLVNFIAPNDLGKREITTTYDAIYSAFPDIVTNPANFRTKMTYDIYGRPVSVKDVENDLTSQTEYDAWGRIVKKVSPQDTLDSPTVKYEYADQTSTGPNVPAMRVKVEKKDVGRYLSAYTFYDDLGQTLQTQSQSANSGKVYTDRTEYDGLGRAFKSYAGQEVSGNLGNYLSSLPNDYVSLVNFDSQGRAFRSVNSDGTCTLTEFNGRQTFSYDPMGNMSLSWIDELGRNKGTAIYSVSKTGAATASVGNGVKTIFSSALSGIFKPDSPLGTPINSDLFKSNFCSSPPAVSFPRSSYAYSIYTSSDTNYDNLDRPVNTAVHSGEVTGTIISRGTTVYDGFGRVVQTTDPDLGNSYVRSYNALGNSLVTEDNNGIKRSAVYDVLGRITDTYEGETLKAHLVYDNTAYGKAKGKLVKEETPNVLSIEYFYQDIAGRPSRVITRLDNGLGGLIEAEDLTYDEAGRVKTRQTRLRVPEHPGVEDGFSDSEKLTTNYDSIGRLTEIQTNYSIGDLPGQNKYVSNLAYNSFNLVTSQTNGNGKVESYTYNEADKSLRLKSHNIPSLMSLNYGSYDNAGNILSLSQTLGTAAQNYNYTYDDFYRLINVTSPYTASYTYDNLNRMLTKNEKENLTFNYSTFNVGNYYPLNAPKAYNGINLSYQKGNLTKLVNGNLVSYDNDSRIIGITLSLPALAVQSSAKNSKPLSQPPSVPGGGAVTAVPTVRVLTPIPTSTPTPALTCSGKYFGKTQCEAKPEVISLKKLHPVGSCQLNKSLGPIDPIKPSAAINYWKWSFCWSTTASVKGITTTGSKTLALKTGWNMVSFSVGSVAPREFFNSIIVGPNALEQVYSFENDTVGWQVFSPASPDYAQSLTVIKSGVGYWVKVNKDVNFIYSINSPSLNTVQLKRSWNLIGVPDNYSKSISEIIGPYTGKIESIWYYTGLAAVGGWQMYNVGSPEFSDLTQLAGGRSYWIKALTDTEFNFNGGSSTTAVSYTYDSKGQRVKQVENQGAAAKITYYLPSLEVIKDVSSTIVRRFYPNNIMRVIKYNNAGSVQENKLYYTYADQISSTKVITDNNGNKVTGSELDYYPYGSIKAGNPANLPTNHLYTGQIADLNTGLYYYNQRYYDPTLGIFTSADRAKGPNRYSYVNGNPIMRNDPTGNVAVEGDGGGGEQRQNIPLQDWFFSPSDSERRAAVDKASAEWYQRTYDYGQENYGWAYRENWNPTVRAALDTIAGAAAVYAVGSSLAVPVYNQVKTAQYASKAQQYTSLAKNADDFAGNPNYDVFYHYTSKEGAEGISSSGTLLAGKGVAEQTGNIFERNNVGQGGQVFVTKLNPFEATPDFPRPFNGIQVFLRVARLINNLGIPGDKMQEYFTIYTPKGSNYWNPTWQNRACLGGFNEFSHQGPISIENSGLRVAGPYSNPMAGNWPWGN